MSIGALRISRRLRITIGLSLPELLSDVCTVCVGVCVAGPQHISLKMTASWH